MDRDALASYRRDRDEFFRSHYASPLSDDDQKMFAGLVHFPPSSDMAFAGRFVPLDDSLVQIASSIGTTSAYHQMGVFHVEIVGTDYDLIVLDDGDGNPFIAFGDATNGSTTYGGGRYVSLDIGPGASASIDFDRASNPYCVYDEEFVCPIPPVQNRIAISIEAGEKMYKRR